MFGTRFDFSDIVDYAKEVGLDIFEDAAEAFEGPEFTGNKECIISSFSFGTSKGSTSFGGCFCVVRDKSVYSKMNSILSTYP
jgi:dTDP-4-amino-4,6-dideoxygalactose transaminase